MSSDLSIEATNRRTKIIASAIVAFSRHGYRRCTMADIADVAGISRPALYVMFPGKPAVFRAVAVHLLADAARLAEAAWPAGSAVADGLAAAILAKDLAIHRLIMASPHAAEILAVAADLAADLHDASADRFQTLLADRLGEAGHRNAAQGARMIAHAANGLKQAAQTEADYVADVHQLAIMVAAAI